MVIMDRLVPGHMAMHCMSPMMSAERTDMDSRPGARHRLSVGSVVSHASAVDGDHVDPAEEEGREDRAGAEEVGLDEVVEQDAEDGSGEEGDDEPDREPEPRGSLPRTPAIIWPTLAVEAEDGEDRAAPMTMLNASTACLFSGGRGP